MWMRAYVVVSSLAIVVLSTAAFRQASKPQNLGEITVERINVVDANGTLRMVISNKDRMHPGVIDGMHAQPPTAASRPGLLQRRRRRGRRPDVQRAEEGRHAKRRTQASTSISSKQDQTIGIGYREFNGQRTAALQVWDPSRRAAERGRSRRINAANAITDPARRAAALRDAEATVPPRPRRIFVGKSPDHSASVALSDGQGRPRLKLTVDANGNPRIEFLDDKGQVTQRLPQGK